MPIVLAALTSFAILTLWVPAYWPVAAFQVGVFLVTGLALLRARHSLPRVFYPLLPISVAVLWGIYQWLSGRTTYAFDTRLAILRWLTFWAVLATSLLLFRDDATRRWFRSFMLWFGFLVAVVAIAQTYTSPNHIFWFFPTNYDQVMGPILYHNHYAAFIELIFPIALWYAFRRPSGGWLYAAIAGVLYASVIVSSSRAGAVLLTAEVTAVLAVLMLRRDLSRRAVGATFLGMLILIAAFTVVVGPENIWQRFRDPGPNQIRRELDISSLHMAADHPWFGTGLGTWPTAYPRYAIVDTGYFANQAHSDWLEWTVEGGIPFGCLLFSLFPWCLRPAFRSVWGIGVPAVFLHAAIDYPFSRPALGSWIILGIGMLAASSRSKNGALEQSGQSPYLAKPR